MENKHRNVTPHVVAAGILYALMSAGMIGIFLSSNWYVALLIPALFGMVVSYFGVSHSNKKVQENGFKNSKEFEDIVDWDKVKSKMQ